MADAPIIRLARPSDGDVLAAIYAPAVTERATSFELVAPDGAEMARRIAAVLPRFPWLVYQIGGTVRGYAYATPHRDRAAYQWSVEVSAYVADSAHRGGVGRALYTSLLAVLAELGLCNAYAGITLPNPASVGFHTAMGFVPVGVYHSVGYKFGTWHDVVWLERAIVPHPASPAAPRELASVLHEPAVHAAITSGLSGSASTTPSPGTRRPPAG